MENAAISEGKRNGVFIISPEGPIDSENYGALGNTVDQILEKSPDELVIDMESVNYMSSAGMRILFKANRSLNDLGGRLILINLQSHVRKVLNLINALPSMTVFESQADLDAYLDKRA